MRNFSRITFMGCILFLMAACGQAQVVPTVTPAPTLAPVPTVTPAPTPITIEELTKAEPAFIRFVNAAPNSKPLNAYLGISTIASNLAFTQSTEPTQLDAGEYDLKILPSGSRPNDTALLETKLDITGGQRLLVLVTEEDGQLSLQNRDEVLAPLNEGETIVTAINALTDSNTAILRDEAAKVDLTVTLNRGEEVSTPILETDINRQITFKVGTSTVSFSETLLERQNYTLIVAGSSDQPVIVSFRQTAPSRVSVRALNASVDVPAIDVYLGDDLLSLAAGYGRPTDRISIAGGEYSVLVYTAGADRSTVEPLLNSIMRLENADNLALILLGTANNLTLMAFEENLSSTASNNSRLAFLNAVPDVETAIVNTSVGSLGGQQTVQYGQAPLELDIESGRYSFSIGALQGLNPTKTLELAENLQLEAGSRYLYLITGNQNNQPIILIESVGVDPTLGDDNAPDTVEKSNPAQIRFINVVEDENLDLYSNGNLLVTGQLYGRASTVIDVVDQHPTLEVRTSGGTTSLAQTEGDFEIGDRVTVLAYKVDQSTIQLIVVSDNLLVFDGSSPYIRLINVSGNEEAVIALAFTEPGPTPPPPSQSSESATEEVSTGPLTLPYGLQKLVTDLASGSASSPILMPIGNFDLYIINSQRNEIVTTIAAQKLEAGIHTDIIAYQTVDGKTFRAFVVQYARPD